MVSGRVAITPRALETVARGVAAERLGVDASRVSIRLSDSAGLLAVAVSAPLRAEPLAAAGQLGLMTRAESARVDIVRDIAQLTGSQVGDVALRISGIQISTGRRVS